MCVNEGQRRFLDVKVVTISSYIVRPAAQSSQISKLLHEFWSTDLFDLAGRADRGPLIVFIEVEPHQPFDCLYSNNSVFYMYILYSCILVQ